MKTIEVVAAVIFDEQGRIFATQRGYGEWKDWWEFPGGKMEAGETPQQALRREIHEELDAEIEMNLAVGNKYLICPWHDMKDHEGALRFAEIMNRTADKLRPHGLRLGYHNHAHDMAVDRGEVLLDTLLANTEEDIFMEFDVFWVEYAGFSPLRYISRYAGRQPLMHLKELGADRKSNVEIGAGISDFAAFIRLGREIGTEQFIVEQEEYTMPPLESCRKSLESLLKL